MYGRIASSSEVELPPVAAASASRTISDLLRLDAAESASRRENSRPESLTLILGILEGYYGACEEQYAVLIAGRWELSDRVHAEFSEDAIDYHGQAAGCLLGKMPPVYWRLCPPLLK